jgi:hypothetical protein
MISWEYGLDAIQCINKIMGYSYDVSEVGSAAIKYKEKTHGLCC